MKEAREALKVLNEGLKAGTAAHEAVKADIMVAKADIKKLDEGIAFERALTNTMSTEHDHLMQEVVDQKRRNASLTQRVASLSTSLSDTSEQLRTVSNDKAAMRQKLDDAEATIRKMSPPPPRSPTRSTGIEYAKRRQDKFIEFISRKKLQAKGYDPALHSNETLEEFRRETITDAGRWATA